MTIKQGDKIPAVMIKQLTDSGMQDLATDSVFSGRKVVMFAVPGAFTPTCSAKHLPSYLQNLEAFKKQGIEVVCLAVNDPFVMKAWATQNQAEAIQMLADGNATFTKALGLDMDGKGYGLGIRAQRFALYAEDGVVRYVAVEKPGSFEVSSGDAVLKALASHQAAA